MAEVRYNYGPANNAAGYNPSQLDGEIRAAITLGATVLNVLGSGFLQGSIICPNVVIAVNPDITPAQKTALDSVIAAHVPSGPRRKRRLLDILADVQALSLTPQQANVWANLTAGTPPLWSTDAGANAAAMAAMHFLTGVASFTAAQRRGFVSMYVQDNVTYLVRPAFDSTVNVAGDEPAP